MRAFFLVVEIANDGNIFANQAQQRTLKISDNGINFDNDVFQRLLATEGEKLLRQSRGASGRSANFGDVIGQHPFDLPFVQKKIAVAKNRGQKIIEIVGKAARQLTERFHFLGTTKLILKLFARGHVHQRADEARGFAVVIPQDERSFQYTDVTSIRAAKTVFAIPMIGFATQGMM